MQKINVITEGDYKGHLVVFSQGSLWINTGVLGLKRMNANDLSSAKVIDAQNRTISVVFNDGASSTVLMGPKLFSAALDSLSPLFTTEEITFARKAAKASGTGPKNDCNIGHVKEIQENKVTKKAPVPAIILAAAGLVLIVVLKLIGKI